MSEQIWFTSDTHFGHAKVIEYSNRPFADVDEMNEIMIQNWNACVKPGDTIYHLGDFAMSCHWRKVEEILKRLNGKKQIIFGNHDKFWARKAKLRDFFDICYGDPKRRWDAIVNLKVGEQRLVLGHYGIESWDKRHHGSWHLHGHSHGGLPSPKWQPRVDVGVDVWNYKPVSYEEIVEHMSKKEWQPIDQHDYKGKCRHCKGDGQFNEGGAISICSHCDGVGRVYK